MKKVLALVLAMTLALTSAAALAEVAVNEPGQLPIVNEPITLTVGVEQSAVIEDWETNLQTLLMEEKTGINLEFVQYPAKEMGTKLELAIAAGGDDLPDILLGGFSQNQIMPWAEAGMIIPLTEYFNTLSYWPAQSCAVSDSLSPEKALSYITSYDGEIYGHYRWNGFGNNEVSGNRLNFYVPWLEKLGLEKPTTLEELYNVLVAFRDQDPNGNGIQDEIPLTGYADQVGNLRKVLMTPFVYTQNEYWTNTDGTIGVCFNTDEWREGLRFVHKLFAEGLADPAIFTQDQNAMTITLSQDPQVVGAFNRFSSTCMSADDPDRYEWDRQDYFTDFNGETVTSLNPALPVITALITKNCENPQAAFMLLDYMTSFEISTLTRFGFAEEVGDDSARYQQYLDFWQNEARYNYPEIYYGDDPENPEYILLNKYNYDASSWGTLQNTWWAEIGPQILPAETMALFAVGGNIGTEIEKLSYVNEYRARHAMLDALSHADESQVVAGLIYTADEQEVITDYYAEIKSFVESTWAAYAIGTLDIEDDAAWNDYINQLERMNLAECVEVTQAAFDRQQGK